MAKSNEPKSKEDALKVVTLTAKYQTRLEAANPSSGGILRAQKSKNPRKSSVGLQIDGFSEIGTLASLEVQATGFRQVEVANKKVGDDPEQERL